MSTLLISDEMTELQEISPLVSQDSTRGLRLLLNRCLSFSLNSSPTLKPHKSNGIGNPMLKDNFTLHVGSQVHSKKNFLDPKTFETFVNKEKMENDSSISPKNSLQKGVLGYNNNQYKRNRSTGKMYVKELWSKKHYHDIVNTSHLAKQQEEIIRKNFQTTEEKNYEINELCRAKLAHKSLQGKYLLDKYQNKESITEEDLSLQPDFDYKFAASKFPDKSELSISKSQTRFIRRSGIEDLVTSIKEEEQPTLPEARNKKKKPNTLILPSLDKGLGETRQILKLKEQSASVNASPDMNRLFASPKNQESRHINKVRLRGYCRESEYKTLNYSPKVGSLRSSKVLQYNGGVSFQNDFDIESTAKPFSESRISLIKLVNNCKEFNEDKSVMKLVDDISYNFGPNKHLKDAEDQKKRREKLKKQNLLEVCVHLHKERKKKDKSLEF